MESALAHLRSAHEPAAAELLSCSAAEDFKKHPAKSWLAERREFTGLISWPQRWNSRHPVRAFLDAFDDLAAPDEPFAYPIVYLRLRS